MKNPFRKPPGTPHLNPNEKEIVRIYNSFRESFIRCFRTHSVDITLLEDICQDSFIELHEKMQQGKIPEGILLIKYLFVIGRNKLMKYFEQQKKHAITPMEEFPGYMNVDDSIEWEEEQKIVREIIHNMERICKEILSLFYLEEKKWPEIMTLMGFKSYNDAKNRKSRCHKKLMAAARDRLKKEGLMK